MSSKLTITAPEGFTNPRLGYVQEGQWYFKPGEKPMKATRSLGISNLYGIMIDKIEPRTWKLTECEFRDATKHETLQGCRMSIDQKGVLKFRSFINPVGITWVRLKSIEEFAR